jgi:hypothetical protein
MFKIKKKAAAKAAALTDNYSTINHIMRKS